jgi:hypothetical protein
VDKGKYFSERKKERERFPPGRRKTQTPPKEKMMQSRLEVHARERARNPATT